MPKPNSRQPMRHQDATESDLHQILGDMDDSTALEILACIQLSRSSKKRESGSTEEAISSAKNIVRLMAS